MVQTIGSAGESLAAGAIFTLPALFLWAKEGVMNAPSLLEISIISVCGGLLGVLFMVPLRNALIVNEHGVLPYPEGTACMLGGVLRAIVDKKKAKGGEKENEESGSGILFCSGMIAGEGLVGILLALEKTTYFIHSFR